jgi:CHAD domain-containing protein
VPARRPRKRAKATATKRTQRPHWSKASPVTLSADGSIHEMIAAVIRSCRGHWDANIAAALDGRDPEGIHQVRVGLRRLRSALSLFKKQIPAAQRAALGAEAKWLFGQLGAVRDLDVFLASLPEDKKMAAVAEVAQRLRARAHAAAAVALQSVRARRFAHRVDVWLQGRGWRSGDDAVSPESLARAALNRRLRKIREAAEHITSLSVAERHELRIAVKKSRYGLEFLKPLLPEKRAARWTAALKRLQDSLGHLNDVDVAQRTVTLLVRSAGRSRAAVSRGGQILIRDHKKALAAAEPQLRKDCLKLAALPLL